MFFTVFGREFSTSHVASESLVGGQRNPGVEINLLRIELARHLRRVHLKQETGTSEVPTDKAECRYGSAAGYIGIRLAM